jgi:predicted DNA-binding transcriptional regulator YafY
MRGDNVERAFRIVQMFQSGPVTARMIADRFHIHRSCANRWIDQISRHGSIINLPIFESGLDYSGGGRPGMVYELMIERK